MLKNNKKNQGNPSTCISINFNEQSSSTFSDDFCDKSNVKYDISYLNKLTPF